MVNICFIGKRSGVVSSRMTKCPPVLRTRYISESPLSKSSKLRIPKATVIASKRLSANEREGTVFPLQKIFFRKDLPFLPFTSHIHHSFRNVCSDQLFGLQFMACQDSKITGAGCYIHYLLRTERFEPIDCLSPPAPVDP